MKVTAWTKAKFAAVIGAALVVATGTTTVVFNHAKPSPIDAYLSDSELTAFRKAPPLVLIQPTHIAKMKGREITIAVNENGKRVGRCVWLGSMIADAYGFSLQRIVFTTGTPTNYYDYLVTVPDASSEKFKEEIKKNIGYVGRKETRTVDVLLLRTNYSTATKLKANTDRYRQSTDAERRKNAFKTSLSFPTLASLTSQLETFFWRPVIDETGVTNSCAVVLDWKPQWKAPVEIRPGRTAEIQPDREMSEPQSGLSEESLLSLKDALLDQAGLELVPSRKPVEVLLVERTRN